MIPTPQQTADMNAIEDVTFLGYPSGLVDEQNATPIVRRGITATPFSNDFQGRPEFLIDAGVYPGSSGSPVFLYNEGAYTGPSGVIVGSRLLFLGMITSTLQRREGTNNIYLGLGSVLKSGTIRNWLQEAVDRFARTGGGE
jgi:hypothetical protein